MGEDNTSSNEELRLVRFQSDSEFNECGLCDTPIPYKEWMQATPSTELPLASWTNKRCYPDCEQAKRDRKNRKPEPVPAGGVPPTTKTFLTKVSYNVCIRCHAFIKLGTRVTATRVDVPYGFFLRRWRDFYHYGSCPPPVSPSPTRTPSCDSAPIDPVNKEEDEDEEEETEREEENVGADVVRPEDVEEGHGADVVRPEDVEDGHGDDRVKTTDGVSKRCADTPPSPPRKRSRSSSQGQASSGGDEDETSTSRNLAETEGWAEPPTPSSAPVEQEELPNTA